MPVGPPIGPKGVMLHDRDAVGITSTAAAAKQALDVNIAAGSISLTALVLTATHSVATVGTSDATVLAGNTNRKAMLFINDSANTIWLAIDGNASAADTGIRLNARGGSFLMGPPEIVTGKIAGIASASSSVLLVTEFT